MLYISCSLETLARDLATLSATHEIESLAFFDQFPYTHHLESGVVLKKSSMKALSPEYIQERLTPTRLAP